MSVRILLFSQYFPPEMGALAARSYEHSLWWVQMGHKVTVICGTPNYPDGKVYEGFRNRLFQRQDVDGIEVIRTWVLPQPNRNTWERISNYLSYFITSVLAGFRARKPDIVIGSSPQLLTGLAAYIVARVKRVPFVFEVRDLWPETLLAAGPTTNWVVVWMLRKVANFLYAKASRIIVVAESFKEYLQEHYGVDPSKVDFIPNGTNLALLDPSKTDGQNIREQLGLSNKLVVSFVGIIGACQGIGTVLEAAKQMEHDQGVVFLLVGDGAEKDILEKRARSWRLTNVRFLGKRPSGEIPELLAASDVSLVLLKNGEIFRTVIPSKMVEAMAMAKPVILGVEGEAKRILEGANAGIAIVPESAEQLVDAIHDLMGDHDRARALGENGRQFVAHHRDRKQLASELVAILESVADERYDRH